MLHINHPSHVFSVATSCSPIFLQMHVFLFTTDFFFDHLYLYLVVSVLCIQIRLMRVLQEGAVSCAGSSKNGETLKDACANSYHEPRRLKTSTTLFKMSFFVVHIFQSRTFRLVDLANEIGNCAIVSLPFFHEFVVNFTCGLKLIALHWDIESPRLLSKQ